MLTKVIVLISTHPEKEKETIDYLRETHRVKTLYLVDGIYNIVAIIKIEQPMIAKNLLSNLKTIDGIKTIDILTIREENT